MVLKPEKSRSWIEMSVVTTTWATELPEQEPGSSAVAFGLLYARMFSV